MSKNSDDGQHSSFKKWTEFKDLDRRHVPPPRSPSELVNFGDNSSEFHSRSLPINLDNPLSDFSSHAMLLSNDEFTTFSKEHDSLAEGVCQKAFGTEMSGAADLVNPEPNINPDLVKSKPENFHREDKDAFETTSTSSSFATDKSQLSLTKHFPDSPRNTFTPVRFSSGNERILIDDDLFSDPRHTNSLDLEQSLELFQSAQTVNTPPKKIPKPPRPPPPAAQILQETEHPLMTSEPIQVDEVMQYLLEEAELNKKQQKGCRSPAPPLKSITSFNDSEEKNTSLKSITSLNESEEKNTSLKSITSLNESEDKATCEGSLYDETAYGSVSRKPLFVRGQKLRYFKETIKDKANKAYNRWYYPKYKGAEPSLSDSKERKTSESSNESFQEINNDDFEPLEDPVDDNFQPSTAFSSPNRHSDNSSDEQMPPQIEVPIVVADTVTTESSPSTTIPQPPSFSSIHISSNQRKYILYSIWACAFSVLTYFLLFSSRIFIHGILTGTLIPLLCCFVYQYLSSSSNEEDNRVRNYSTVQCNRLRDMGSKYTIKDFFQYTESPNFGDLRFKNLPYRYIKLKGCVIEAYELNATKEQVPNPAVLTTEEIKAYGLKLVFKVNIVGWKISVEAPSGYKVTPNTMWKKKYPIWVRKPAWKSIFNDYMCDNEQDVTSFYLFAPFSRYKELWYERLRSVANKVDPCSDSQNTKGSFETLDYNSEHQIELLKSYQAFMEKLFNEIPNEDDKPDSDTPVSDAITSPVPPTYSNPPSDVTNFTEEGSSQDDKLERERLEKEREGMRDVAWINALFGRFLWNLLHDVKWENRIRERIVRKLSSIQSTIISAVELVHFDLGNTVPLISRTYLPKIDNQGVWSDMDIKWTGQVALSLLVRFQGNVPRSQTPASSGDSRNLEQMTLDSSTTGANTPISERSGYSARILKKFIDRIEVEVSVVVRHVSGRVCVNIPPPPTDCVWYGFKSPPVLELQITPRLKGINLNYKMITTALEKQLKVLFDETFVLPAMENIVIPGMCRDLKTRQITAVNLDLDDLDQLLDVVTASSSK